MALKPQNWSQLNQIKSALSKYVSLIEWFTPAESQMILNECKFSFYKHPTKQSPKQSRESSFVFFR